MDRARVAMGLIWVCSFLLVGITHTAPVVDTTTQTPDTEVTGAFKLIAGRRRRSGDGVGEKGVPFQKDCERLRLMAKDVKETASELFNLTCEFTSDQDKGASCVNHVINWAKNNARLLPNRTQSNNNNITMQEVLYGVVAHEMLADMVYCTNEQHECPTERTVLRDCKYTGAGQAIHRHPSTTYCNRSRNLTPLLVTRHLFLKHNLQAFNLTNDVLTLEGLDWEPNTGLNNTDQRVSYYLASLYSAFLHANTTIQVIDSMCKYAVPDTDTFVETQHRNNGY